MKKFGFLFSLIIVTCIIGFYFLQPIQVSAPAQFVSQERSPVTNDKFGQSQEPVEQELPKIPNSKVLPTNYHVFQTFNNCGPASLSMALSHYGINKTQQELGAELRPYQNPQGDNDDKSVTLEELALKAQEYGFEVYHRPNGDFELLTMFIANDMPVLTRTWLKSDDDIGHFRVVKGYNLSARFLIQDDSYQGKNLAYTESEFNEIWNKFGYEYLVLVPKEKTAVAQKILGQNLDENTAWTNALKYWQNQVSTSPADVNARFNLSVAYYKTGDFQKSVEEFEKVESQLAPRTLWYQIEPLLAYYELKNYDRVFELVDKILNNHNRAFSELYILRGNIYKDQGQTDKARAEYEKAIFYNSNLKSAKDALNSL